MYPYLKALHIIFVVTWFAGLFYIVRLFIYATEANNKPPTERNILLPQFLLMQKRLWLGITVPSAIITFVLGFAVLYQVPAYFSEPWLWVKLGFVAGLYAYHFSCTYIFRQQKAGVFKYSSTKLRIWNEVTTLFLFAIIFLVVVKHAFSWVWGLVGILILALVLAIAIFIYKKIRN